MFPFNKLYALAGAVVVALLMSLLWYAEKQSHKATIIEFDAFKTKIAADAKVLEGRQDLINKTIVNSYESAMEDLERHYEDNPDIKRIYIDRLQHDSTSCNEASTTAEATDTRPDGVEEDTSGRNSRTVLDLHKASQEVVQCLELIKWAKEQAEAGEGVESK